MTTAAASGITEADWHAATAIVAGLARPAPILLTCHVNPDGDALGSMLGFGLGLRRLGFTGVRASFPEPFEVPATLGFLPGQDLLTPPDQTPPAPELAMSFDAASPDRLGALLTPLRRAGAWIVVDHHASNPGFGTIRLIDPSAPATASVAAALLDRLPVAYDRDLATCLYAALTTDTGSFKFASTTASTHLLAARRVGAGVCPADVAREVFDSRPFGAVRLLGAVLARAEFEPAGAGGRGLVLSYATPADLARFDQPAVVLESFIEVLRTTTEADVACLVKPVRPGEWGVSLRSRGATDVAGVAIALGGGGHRLAAGYSGSGELAEVIATVRQRLNGDESGSIGG